MPDLSQTFAALGDPTRFAIVNRLLNEGAQSAGQLSAVSDLSAPAVSRHLKVLREAGVVTRRIDQQRRIYTINPEAVRAVGEWTLSHREFWTNSLDRLARALQNKD